MYPESAVGCFKKQPDVFARQVIQVNGNSGPIFIPNGGIASRSL